MEQREAPLLQRPAKAWRVAKRLAADHLVQAQGWPLPYGAIGCGRGIGKPEDLNLYSNVGKCPAQPRDADPDAGGAARRMRGEQTDLHSVRRASAHRSARSNHDGIRRRPAQCRLDRLHQPIGKALRPPVGDDPLAGPAHRVALLVGHGGDPLHQPGELLDVVGIEGEAVDADLHEIGGTAAAFGNEHRQARGHGLVDHQTPLLGRAGVDEGAGEAVVGGQLVVLFEAGEKDILGDAQLLDPAGQLWAKVAIAQDHEAPMAALGPGSMERIGFQ